MRNNKFALIFCIVATTAILSFSAGHVFTQNKNTSAGKAANDPQNQTQSSPQATSAPDNSEIPFLPGVFSTEASDSHLTLFERLLNIFFRLFLAVILSAILAFRPRRNVPLFQRNLNVARLLPEE